MRILRIILLVLLIMPFLFVVGTIASSADQLGTVSIGSYNLQPQKIAEFGNGLISATEEVVAMEIGLVKRVFAYLKDYGYPAIRNAPLNIRDIQTPKGQ
jgi:hypothetical protein